jgi:carboxyl-terminal processing protease
MKNSYTSEQTKRAQIIVLSIAVCLILLLTLYALVTGLSGDRMLSKEEILTLIDSYEGERSNVSQYIEDFGIGGFNKTRLRDVEFYYEKYYYTEALPSDLDLAKETATLFVGIFYDEIDLENRDEVTEALINCYIYNIGDLYGVYRSPIEYDDYSQDMSGTGVGIGVTVKMTQSPFTMLVEEVIPGSGAEAAGILPGDYIVAVDGVSVQTLQSDGAKAALSGDVGTTVNVTVLRGSEELTLTVTRCAFVETVVKYSIDDKKLAYIRISSFKDNTDEQLAEALSRARQDGAVGIIFDMRNNLGGYLDSALGSIELIVKEGVRMASYTSRGLGETVYNSKNADFLELPVVVLCNEYTASAGELFTAAIRDFRDMGLIKATVVGTKTYGKGVMQSTYTFLDGAALTMTTAYYNPPSNQNYDGVGIVPDEEIILGREYDNQLEGAKNSLLDLINAN